MINNLRILVYVFLVSFAINSIFSIIIWGSGEIFHGQNNYGNKIPFLDFFPKVSYKC